MNIEVVIVGAGPTGLMLAGWLARSGIRALVLDKKKGIVSETRALGVQARTLETYEMLGLSDRALEQGLISKAATLWSEGRQVARADLQGMGEGLSPFPHILMLPQSNNEAILLEHLRAHGGEVDWESELLDYQAVAEGYRLRWRQGGAERETTCRYLCGCDGGHSLVRRVPFEGGTYESLFYVADVEARGSIHPREVNLCLHSDLFEAFFPMPGENRYRIVGLIPVGVEARSFEDVRDAAESRFGVRVEAVHSFSQYRVHHRKAAHFRDGNTFLLGDAAHVHSPVGAQGMNTGLMDATNLGWKLAAVLQGRACERILDSYGSEREPFARSLVNTTDRVFTLVTNRGWRGRLMRSLVMPNVFRLVTALPFARGLIFQFLSQIRVHYRNSPLSSSGGGERLPYVPGLGNYAPLTSLDWQIHVYGGRGACLPLPVHSFPWSRACNRAGLRRGWYYLVRPDGYVACKSRRLADLEDYLKRWEITRSS